MAANRAFAGLLTQYLLMVICGFEHKLCSNYVQAKMCNILELVNIKRFLINHIISQ